MFNILFILGIFFNQGDLLYGNHFTLPYVPPKMTYREYKILTWKISYDDYAFSAFIPGYMHFMLDKKLTGAMILGGRMVLSGALVYGIASLYSGVTNPDPDVGKQRRKINLSISLLLTGFMGNMFLTAYDIAHGKWLLREMRARVFFKYRKILE